MAGSPYPKRLYMGQPGTAATTLYTAPSASSGMTNVGTTSIPLATAMIKALWLVNPTSGSATITVGINGTAAANQIVPTVTVGAYDAKPIDITDGIMLSAGDTLQALQGTASAITVIASGVEIQ